jgi:hypothetical protein
VVAGVRIERSDDGEEGSDAADLTRVHRADAVRDTEPVRGAADERDGAGQRADDSAARVARNLEYRETAETTRSTRSARKKRTGSSSASAAR